ncbi:unnamed protein product, partial [marine sediment metagenome]
MSEKGKVVVKALVTGGSASGGPPIGPAVGPTGINIKDKCKNVPKSEAYNHILGYSVFNDITARKMQRRDVVSQRPWFRSKSFDTFGIIGPRIVPTNEIDDPH